MPYSMMRSLIDADVYVDVTGLLLAVKRRLEPGA